MSFDHVSRLKRRSFVKKATASVVALIGLRGRGVNAGFLGSYGKKVRPRILEWLESIRYKNAGWGRWKYNTAMSRDYALESSAQVISILESLDALSDVPHWQKQEGIEFLESCLDEKTGYLVDPLVDDADHSGGNHSWEHIWAHVDGVARSALEKLGGSSKPKATHADALFYDLNDGAGVEWLLEQPWERPWMVAEHMLRVVNGTGINCLKINGTRPSPELRSCSMPTNTAS